MALSLAACLLAQQNNLDSRYNATQVKSKERIMAMVLVIVAGVLMTVGFLMSQRGDGSLPFIIGVVVFIVGALLHMRNRRNEQLEAMRGRKKDE